jgi:hypothetical protein
MSNDFKQPVSDCARHIQKMWTRENSKRYHLTVSVSIHEDNVTWRSFAYFAGMSMADIEKFKAMIQADRETRPFQITFKIAEQ